MIARDLQMSYSARNCHLERFPASVASALSPQYSRLPLWGPIVFSAMLSVPATDRILKAANLLQTEISAHLLIQSSADNQDPIQQKYL